MADKTMEEAPEKVVLDKPDSDGSTPPAEPEKVAPQKPAAPSPPAHEADPRRWIVLGVVLTATFMILLDISIVNVAIPSIQRDLKATYAQVQLVIAFYALTYAVVLITGSRLGDIFGRKLLFMIGLGGFTAASALCGLAQSPEMLIGSRILQGMFAALMYPQVLSMIQVAFPPQERGGAFAVLGAIIGIATIAGPLLGGTLIQANLAGLDWRPIFLVNVPVGALALMAALFLLHESKAEHANRLDFFGVFVVTIGLGLLVYPLIAGRDAGWPDWAFVALVESVPVLLAFLIFEALKTAKDRSPLIDMNLFTHPSYVAGLGVGLCLFGGIISFFLTLSITLQLGLGYSALTTGLTTLPFSLASMIGSILSARLTPRLGRRIMSIGTLLLVMGAAGVIYTIHTYGTDLQGYQLAPAMAVGGFGLGLTVAPFLNFILATIPLRIAGAASGVFTTVQQIGSSLGIALIGVIFFGAIGATADTATSNLHAQLTGQLTQAGVPSQIIPTFLQAFDTCFHDRANERDPTALPESCRRAQESRPPGIPQEVGQKLGGIFNVAAAHALKDDFQRSAQIGLLFCVGIWGLAHLLVPALPRRPGGPPAAPAEG